MELNIKQKGNLIYVNPPTDPKLRYKYYRRLEAWARLQKKRIYSLPPSHVNHKKVFKLVPRFQPTITQTDYDNTITDFLGGTR